MNHWTELSIEYANQRNYLDDLFKIYPTVPDGIRDIDPKILKNIEDSFNAKDNLKLVKACLDCKLFPIKDSYIAYLRKDKNAITRNPQTVNRIAGRLYEMGLNKIYEKCSEPKETNRQIGPYFKNWVNSGALGLFPVSIEEFCSTQDDAILKASDLEMADWCLNNLNYNRNKGLDFVARFNKKYVIGEAKFLTDFGGHQNAQFEDALNTINTKDVNAIKIAILDGVLYIKNETKMHKTMLEKSKEHNIMSALVLREFLYSL